MGGDDRREERPGRDSGDAVEPEDDEPAGRGEDDEDGPPEDEVDEASKESYPGSDAPAW